MALGMKTFGKNVCIPAFERHNVAFVLLKLKLSVLTTNTGELFVVFQICIKK